MLQNVLRLLAALVLIGCAVIALAGPRPAAAEPAAPRIVDPPDPLLLKQIRRYQRQTWRLQRLMGVRRSPTSGTKVRNREYGLWVRNLWHKRAAHAWIRWQRPPRRSAWLCIHSHEGAWTDPNAPYYGGLQMDISFQHTYGRELLRRKGTADNWTPLEQMWVAERAYRSGRGFYPWPNTARYCNLI
ncbi:MAG: hypothetical protein H0V11_08420 [Actinobacteria bacterium]|nr:hypothetical protein [Actinomycetota bacterium]